MCPSTKVPLNADVGHGKSGLGIISVEIHREHNPSDLEIRLLGTSIRAEGIAGIIGAIALFGLILITYFRG